MEDVIVDGVHKIANAMYKRKGYQTIISLHDTRAVLDSFIQLMEGIKNDKSRGHRKDSIPDRPKRTARSKSPDGNKST